MSTRAIDSKPRSQQNPKHPSSTTRLTHHSVSQGRFTGTLDPPLAPEGAEESRQLGALIQARWPSITYASTSLLRRAQDSLKLILATLSPTALESIRITETAKLNERNYGALNGRSKDEVVKEFGFAQTNEWRRGFKAVPPGLGGESLEMTYERVRSYFEEELKPALRRGEEVLVVTHGNTMRALIIWLEGLNLEERDGKSLEGIMRLQLGTAAIRVYTFDGEGKVVDRELFLEDGHEGTQY